MSGDEVLQIRQSCRQQALQTAERMQPSSLTSSQGLNQQEKKSVTNLLSDADKIYDWLIKKLDE